MSGYWTSRWRRLSRLRRLTGASDGPARGQAGEPMGVPGVPPAWELPPPPAKGASGPVTVAIAVGMVGLAGVQAWVGWRGGAIGWLAIGPLVGSLLVGTRHTVALGGWAIALAAVLVAVHPSQTDGANAVRLLVVLLLSGFAMANTTLRQRRDAQLAQISAVARVAQSAILRPVPTRVGRLELAARYQSAAQGARVGGDLLDVVDGPEGICVVVGDVRGKGLPAVRLASLVLAGFRDAARRPGLSLVEVARSVDHGVNLELAEGRESDEGKEEFVTAVFLRLDQQGWLEVVNCGHPPPLRLSRNGQMSLLEPATFATPLGLSPRLEADCYTLRPGDRVLVYTDGLLEARDARGRYFVLRDQLDLLACPSLEDAVGGLLRRVVAHSGKRLHDDVALLLIQASQNDEPGQTAPGRDADWRRMQYKLTSQSHL
jgi:phosphoserine phosphatase RsbU/P